MAEKRRLDRIHKARKNNIEKYKVIRKSCEKPQCPEEKRMRKKVCNRKVRHVKEKLMYGSYKKADKIFT